MVPSGWTSSAPAGPIPTEDGRRSWFAADDDGLPVAASMTAALAAVDAHLEGVERPVVLAGFSQGAAVALAHRLAGGRAAVDGLVVIAGWLPSVDGIDLACAADRIPRLLVVHGEDDEVVPAPMGRSVARLLERHGVETALDVHPGAHDLHAAIPHVRAWLEPGAGPRGGDTRAG